MTADSTLGVATSEVIREALRRRTFAVISHPDAGKSTLTEALALHASAIDTAGAVHGQSGRAGVPPPPGGRDPPPLRVFDVCRARGIPVPTFVNKWDRPGREALELLDEVEQTIGLRPMPVTWPLGVAGDLRGVVEVATGELRRATRPAGGATGGG